MSADECRIVVEMTTTATIANQWAMRVGDRTDGTRTLVHKVTDAFDRDIYLSVKAERDDFGERIKAARAYCDRYSLADLRAILDGAGPVGGVEPPEDVRVREAVRKIAEADIARLVRRGESGVGGVEPR